MGERTRWRRKPRPEPAARHADESAARFELLHEVVTGLSKPQKELPPKFFYDERGSSLFDRITALDEYYLTRIESELLAQLVVPWLHAFSPRALVELGAGSARKTRMLLHGLPPGAHYIPVDISREFVTRSAARLRGDYPGLHIEPLIADIARPLVLPDGLPEPGLFAFLGSTIGNFDTDDAVRLLGRLRAVMRVPDRLLLGADLVKDVAVLERAYNDAEGVTAEFNRNVLHVLNRELEADFDAEAWQHVARFDAAQRRIEMHLVTPLGQHVTIPGWRTLAFDPGESIRTEISCKYDRLALEIMLRRAGLELEHWFADPAEGYVVLVARAAAAT